MKKNDETSEDYAKLKNMNNLRNFNFWWWRDPPYKNDDFRHRVQLSRVLRIKFFVNFFTLRVLFFID